MRQNTAINAFMQARNSMAGGSGAASIDTFAQTRADLDALAEALEQGFGGAMIGTLPKGMSGNLDDPSLDPFWQTASDLKAAARARMLNRYVLLCVLGLVAQNCLRWQVRHSAEDALLMTRNFLVVASASI